jgi:4-carboxymuconolactone decarboxylase
MEEQQTPAQRLLGDFAPKMVQLTDDVLTQDELVEALTHLAFYAGWPSGMAALTQLKTITADTGSSASR